MIEIIAVLVILVLIAGVGIPGVDAYIKNSEQTARMDTARTIFMAAQTALTQRYLQDGRYGENAASATIPAPEVIWTNMTQRQLDNADRLGYYTIDLGRGAPGNALYDLLSPYLNDKSVLSGAILLEYNKETGNALSVFYKEADDGAGFSANGLTSFTFRYGSGSSYDVYNRTESALRSGQVGFYGVDSVGDPIVPAPIQPVDVMLVDYTDPQKDRYGLLVANCQLPAVQRSSFTYTLTLKSGGGTVSLTVKEGEKPENPETPEKIIYLGSVPQTLNEALGAPFVVTIGGVERKVVLWKDAEGRTAMLHFVLDGVHQSLGVRENYPELGVGNLSAEFSVTDGTGSKRAVSNADEHTYYDGEKGQNGYPVASVRHLNNLRYLPGEAFTQTADVAMIGCTRGELVFPPLCSAADAALIGADITGFTGTYDGDDNRIYSLNTGSEGNRAGLFDTIAGGATVKHVNLTSSGVGAAPGEGSNTVYGRLCAGGIVAVNEGTIRDCTYIGSVTTPNDRPSGVSGDAGVGGIAGINKGTITQCFAGATVRGYDAAGGVAGRTSGTISYCEVATASVSSTVYGTPYYGARAGKYDYSFGKFARDNNGFVVSVHNSGGAAGGVVGVLDGKEGFVQYCVNAAKVEAGYDGADRDAGGIVGRANCHDQGHEYLCYNINAGSVFGSGTAGGIVGDLLKGSVYACYNNGYVNAVPTDKTPRTVKVDDDNPPNKGNVKAGGILGHGEKSTVADTCYSAQYCGNREGGAFGVMEGKVTNCVFLRNYWNNTGKYRDKENGAAGETSGLTRMDAETLRTTDILTKTGKTDNLPFMKNNGSGIGMFAYPATDPDPYLYPYLREGDLKQLYHRTVYFPVMGEYGMIRLTDEGGRRVRMDVYLIQEDAPVRIELDITTSRLSYDPVCVLSREDLAKLNNGETLHTYAYGRILEWPLSFERRPLEAGKDQRAIARGFDHAYTATMSWEGDIAGSLVQRNVFIANLFDDQTGEWYSKDTVERGAVLAGDPNNPNDSKGAKLEQKAISTGKGGESLECVYVDLDMTSEGSCVVRVVDDTTKATVEEIPINRSYLLNRNIPKTLSDAYEGTRLNGLNGPGIFLVYETDNSVYRLVLSKAGTAVNAGYTDIKWANGMAGFTPRSEANPSPKFHVEVYVGGVKKATSISIDLP